jgi:gamma-D-glutamyl-L-lysine dipeptidyl-peptidase
MEKKEWGIARLSIIPVRKAPDHRSEQVTQLLFGDHYTILEYSDDLKWIKSQSVVDKDTGWVNVNQYYGITEEFFKELNKNEYKISTEIISNAMYKKRPLVIVIGSVLPITVNEIFNSEDYFAFNGESKSLGQKRDFDYLYITATKYFNVPYLWGGKSPFGIDCSGFTQMVFRIAGYSLTRDTSTQVKQGSEIQDFSKIKPGDIAFFTDETGVVNHVGIIIDRNKIMHASGHVRIDKLDEKGIFNELIGRYTHQYYTSRRILK